MPHKCCNLRCQLIFLHGRSRTYRVASLRAGPVGRISYNLYFDCKHVRYVTCDLINEYTVPLSIRMSVRMSIDVIPIIFTCVSLFFLHNHLIFRIEIFVFNPKHGLAKEKVKRGEL